MHCRAVLLAAGLLIGLAGCAAPQAPTRVATPEMVAAAVIPGMLPTLGVIYRNQVIFLGRQMPLPPGEWTELLTRTVVINGTFALAYLIMEQHEGSTVLGLVSMVGPAPGMSGARTGVSTECTSSDVIENDIRAADVNGEEDCLVINFQTVSAFRTGLARVPRGNAGLAFAADVANATFTMLDARNLALPATMVQAGIALAPKNHLPTTIVFQKNPDVEHITPDPTPSRATNAWAPFNLDHDPAKRAYVKRLRAEAEAYRLRLLDALEQPAQVPSGPRLQTTALPVRPAG